jgi:hypothetical protein
VRTTEKGTDPRCETGVKRRMLRLVVICCDLFVSPGKVLVCPFWELSACSPTNYGILHSGCLAGCRYSVETATVKTTMYMYCLLPHGTFSSYSTLTRVQWYWVDVAGSRLLDRGLCPSAYRGSSYRYPQFSFIRWRVQFLTNYSMHLCHMVLL